MKKPRPLIFAVLVLVIVTGFYFLQRPSKSLSAEEYEKTKTGLLSTVQNESPREALVELEKLSEENEAVLQLCHPLVHEIGHGAYAKYADVGAALSYQNDVCGSGYIHGVIESYIDEHGYSADALAKLCSTYGVGAVRDNCYHGVGHGLMFYLGNNVPSSVAACDALQDQKARLRCSEGVFMENFASDEVNHPSEYLNRDDIFYICRAQTKPYQKDTCYFYAPTYYLTLHPGAYNAAFDWCKGAEDWFIGTCIKGTSSRVTKENSKRISYAAHECLKLPAEFQNKCAAGIGSYHFTQYANADKTRAMCNKLYPPLINACLSTISD